MRPHFQHQLEEVGARIAFDVELDTIAMRREECGNLSHILPRDVTLVGARMHRDAGRARVDARADGVDDAGHGAAARVPERGDFVDVDAEAGTGTAIAEAKASAYHF